MFFVFLLALVFLIILGHYMRLHLNLVINNNTTLEYLEAKRGNREMTNKYNMGTRENWVQIFGRNRFLWFLPIPAIHGEFQGINYPIRNQND